MPSRDEISVNKTIGAIEALGLSVTAADLATHTGAPIEQARRRLNEVAARTGAVLEVSSAGKVHYKFLPSFKNAYVLTGVAAILESALLFLGQAGFFLLRISFGVMLLLSIAIIFLLLLAVLIAGLGEAGGGGGNLDLGGNWDIGGGGGGPSTSKKKKVKKSNWFDVTAIGDAFRWNYTNSHTAKIKKYGVPNRSLRLKEQVKSGNFCLECFSFLFGDGDPNFDLEEERWASIAAVIKENNCAVVAEQLEPYLDPTRDQDKSVLEVLQRFDGCPEVTDSGNIVFVFEKMKSENAAAAATTEAQPFLEECRLEFSQYPSSALITILILATLNFWGSWWLFRHIASINLLHHFVILIDCLLAYGSLFLLIPLSRIVANKLINIGIDARNSWREEKSRQLSSMTPEIQNKLNEARMVAGTVLTDKGSETITYTTEKDLLEQQFDQIHD